MKDEVLTANRPLTVEEYIAFEESADVRHEFINGNLIPMPGTTSDHNEICFNIAAALKNMPKVGRIAYNRSPIFSYLCPCHSVQHRPANSFALIPARD